MHDMDKNICLYIPSTGEIWVCVYRCAVFYQSQVYLTCLAGTEKQQV